jgi:hypothetical protein
LKQDGSSAEDQYSRVTVKEASGPRDRAKLALTFPAGWSRHIVIELWGDVRSAERTSPRFVQARRRALALQTSGFLSKALTATVSLSVAVLRSIADHQCGAVPDVEGAPVPVGAVPVEGAPAPSYFFLVIAIPLAVLPGRAKSPLLIAGAEGAAEPAVGEPLPLVSVECVMGLALFAPVAGSPLVLLGTVAPVSGTGTPPFPFCA